MAAISNRFWASGAVAILAAFSGGATSPDAPFDFRGIKLGITLDELKTTPYPDGSEAAGVICSGDKVEKEVVRPSVSTDQAAIGDIRCAYITRKFPRVMVSFDLGRGQWMNVTFHTVADPSDKTQRLARIEGTSPEAAMGAIMDGLTAKFGPPMTSMGTAQNGFGAQYPQLTAVWANSASTVTLRSPGDRVGFLRLVYEDRRLKDVEAKTLEAILGGPKL